MNRKWLNEYLLSSDVSCGNHKTDTCSECPQGHGESLCKGECIWNSQTLTCNEKGMSSDYRIASSYLLEIANWKITKRAEGKNILYCIPQIEARVILLTSIFNI